ncbi:hypothetical protein N3K63_02725 [Microbacterium sp. W1N]|uniref:hypothetical protein n=1 Tax=Microbacterium festucae TaxID=2977531 RepID=UPI0021C00FCD|nr:hypothetical protein [Microbacterium festucae]MCT9819196.1 hypothetical protein [Microbacterium festucae]
MTTSRLLSVAALVAAGMLALAGCAANTPAPAASGDAPASSGVVQPGQELEVDAAWLAGGTAIALVTSGSSTCVPTASEATVQADGTLAVTLTDIEGQACTRDLVPRASFVALPEGVDPTRELDIVVTYADATGDTDLDGYSGGPVEEFTPSAGWVDDDQLVLLTFGSSSCAPVVENVEVAGAAVTVTFVAPAADQVCTMDMAPRLTLVTAPEAEDDNATLTLAGGGAEFATPVTIPIAD